MTSISKKTAGAGLALAFFVLVAAGCARAPREPYPSELLTSPQTRPSPEIMEAAREAGGRTDRQRLLAALRYVGEHLAYDPGENSLQFHRDAAALFRDKTLGGCSEFGLAVLALVRAMGYPARIVLTVNAKWLPRFRHNPLAVPNGHGFVEVFVRGRWLVLDPTGFAVYDCGGGNPCCLPGNEIILERAPDFWTAGITSPELANDYLRRAAQARERTYEPPGCEDTAKVDFDYPRAFTNLGEVFLERGKAELARRLFQKSVELAPDSASAHLGLGRCLLLRGDEAAAGREFARVLELDPSNAAAKALAARVGGNGSRPTGE